MTSQRRDFLEPSCGPDIMRSVHDNKLVGFSVDGSAKRIVLNTINDEQTPVEHTDVVFDGVIDHFFRDALLPSIIFDIEPADATFVLTRYLDVISTGYRRGGWPSFYDAEVSAMENNISAAGCTIFTIESSYGIDGWIVARTMQIKTANAR